MCAQFTQTTYIERIHTVTPTKCFASKQFTYSQQHSRLIASAPFSTLREDACANFQFFTANECLVTEQEIKSGNMQKIFFHITLES